MPASSLDPILRPTSVAVVGASRQENTIGWQILDNLLTHGFQGAVYPVNPKATAVHSVSAYAAVSAIPKAPDLAVIAVPKEHVLQVVKDCIRAGVKGLVVISAGFKEVGGAGVERERELLGVVKAAGLRLVGPNCMGVINTDPAVRLNATFAPAMPPAGPVAFMSQSGAMGLSVLDYAESLGIGISMFVSAGNKADVSGNDLLEYAGQDGRTTMVLMYLENFGNPARFVEIGRKLSRTKPICVVKSGRTGAGARAAQSHTGALAGTELATDAIIAQAGAMRAETVEELFDLAMAFANQPLPSGNRVAIVTNAGGPGIITADACEANGLTVTPLAAATEKKLQSRLPEEASVRNPVDLIASATAQSYEFALDCVLQDPNVDAAIAAFVPPLGIQTKDVAEAIVRVNARHQAKPLLAVLMGRQGLPAGLAELHEARVPAYIFPESAARALGAMWRHRRQATRPLGAVPPLKTDDRAVTKILDATVNAGHTKLSEPDALKVLEAYGIPVVPWRFVSKDGPASLPNGAAQAAATLGFPVALKVVSQAVVHKTDVGGVALNLASEAAVSRAVREIIQRVTTGARKPKEKAKKGPSHEAEPAIDGILVQKMAPPGRETIVGMTRTPGVGPMVMFGLGGVYVEVLRDVVLRLAPITDADADAMLRGVRSFALLEGVRGEAARDLGALTDALLRVSQLAARHPRIAELDINPLLSLAKGALALDARINVAPLP
ncbi:MAG TPA: acetate--CoA ligase family protein [Gemmatimonadales bacterium]